MKKVFLENLPRGKNNSIEWKNSIGMCIKFIYDNINGEFIIKDCYTVGTNSMLEIEYNEKLYKIQSYYLLKCYLQKIVKPYPDFKYKLNQKIVDSKRDMTITKMEYRKKVYRGKTYNIKWYKYNCNKCGWENGWIDEDHLIRKHGCQCCSGQITIKGINDLPTVAPWLVKYFKNGYDEACNYTINSGKKVDIVCPECGKIYNNITINRLYSGNFKCICNRVLSYPERVIHEILTYLNIEYDSQKSAKELFGVKDRKIFDFYIPSLKTIIETHGGQHFISYNGYYEGQLDKIKENDKIKRELALKNGIIHYIIIDCRYSVFEYIKKSIISSGLLNVLQVYESNIDWNLCNKNSISNKIKEICNYKNNNPNISDEYIENVFHISHTTLLNYYKIGTNYGWYNYIPSRPRKIRILKDNCLIGVYDSAKELSNRSIIDFGIYLNDNNIRGNCIGKTKTYKGFSFQYIK